MEEFAGNLGEDESVGCQDFVVMFVFDRDTPRLPACFTVGGELGVPRLVPAKMFERSRQDFAQHDRSQRIAPSSVDSKMSPKTVEQYVLDQLDRAGLSGTMPSPPRPWPCSSARAKGSCAAPATCVWARSSKRSGTGPASSPARRQLCFARLPGLIVKDGYWRWPERNLAGNTIEFHVQVLGLSFHGAMARSLNPNPPAGVVTLQRQCGTTAQPCRVRWQCDKIPKFPGNQKTAAAVATVRSERGYSETNYDASPVNCPKPLRRQISQKYDQKKVRNSLPDLSKQILQ